MTEHQFESTQLLLNAFGNGKRVLRYTWKMTPGQRLFEDQVWRKYFELTSSLAIAGAIEIRAILIMDERGACDTTNIRKTLEFLASQENVTAKIVVSADWDPCAMDHAIPGESVEFGIYGTNLLYEANTYTPVSVGSWSKNPIEIERYTRFFDAMWNSQMIAESNPASSGVKVGLSQVMAADCEIDRRQNAAQNVVHDRVARIEQSLKSEAA